MLIVKEKKMRINYSGEWQVNPYPGFLIAIDSLDGSGQSTQIDNLAGQLRTRGLRVVVTKEPTDGPFGSLVRTALGHRLKVDDLTLQLGFTTDRGDGLFKDGGTISNLRAGRVVITDRYFWSTLAYGFASGLDMDWLAVLQMKFPIPDETFHLQVPVEVCFERMKTARLGLDLFESMEMLRKVEEGYRILCERFGDHIVVLDGQEAPELVTQRMVARLEKNPKFVGLIGSK